MAQWLRNFLQAAPIANGEKICYTTFESEKPAGHYRVLPEFRAAAIKEEAFMKYVCNLCGWEYDEELGDPDNGIAPGTKFEDLPEDFACPLCGAGKDEFSEA